MLSRFLYRHHPSSLQPDEDLAVIGDVHGCAGLLSKALMLAQGRRVVCVGDYIDRGPDSADVLAMLIERPDVVCIGGNHEDMVLRFLDAPEKSGGAWLRYGGTETLKSYGVDHGHLADTPSALRDLRDRLADKMGDRAIDWLRTRPDCEMSGNVAIVHAGADPRVPMPQQSARSLRWGHERFARAARKDGMWVIHGHVIVPQPQVKGGRIAIDTGAFATGRLTVASVTSGAVVFDQVTED